jgi:predicted amidohydrolase
MKKIRLAAAQMTIQPLRPEKNLERVKYFLEKIGKDNTDLVVFPEGNLFGFVETKKQYHLPDNNRYLEAYRKLANKFNCHIVTGSMILREDNKSYNTTFLIDNEGKILLKYQKIYLFGSERECFSRGKTCPVVKTKLGNIGLMICWDLAFPEVWRVLFKKNAEIVACPAFWSEEDNKFYGNKYKNSTESPFIDACVPARAYENEFCLIYCDGAGSVIQDGEKSTHVGHTQIAVPNLGVVAKLDHNREGLITYELDTQLLQDAEDAYNIRKDYKQIIV